MSDKIKIHRVTGGTTEDEDDLKGCYFLETGTAGQYQFYEKDNDLVNTTPATFASGTTITFSFEDDLMETWTMTPTITGTGQSATATGSWSNNADEIANDEGQFQAAASGTRPDEEEEASSASA